VLAIYHDITKDLTPEEKVQMQKDLLQFTGHLMDDENQAQSTVAKLKTVNKYLLKTGGYVLTFLPVSSCFYRRLPSIWRKIFMLLDLSSTQVLILMHGRWVVQTSLRVQIRGLPSGLHVQSSCRTLPR